MENNFEQLVKEAARYQNIYYGFTKGTTARVNQAVINNAKDKFHKALKALMYKAHSSVQLDIVLNKLCKKGYASSETIKNHLCINFQKTKSHALQH